MAENTIAKGGGDTLPGTQNISGADKDKILDNSKGELSDGSSYVDDLGYPSAGANLNKSTGGGS